MPNSTICTLCRGKLVATDHHVMACSMCGAIDEQTTSTRNSKDVNVRFGTLMNEGGVSSIEFTELQEKNHETYIQRLLYIYLVEPTSRIVNRPGEHFMAGARAWYNRIRGKERDTLQLKRVSTNNNAKKVKYKVVVAIRLAIQESNIFVLNNRLANVKPRLSSHAALARGDASIMTPTLSYIFLRTNQLGPDHIGYLDSLSLLQSTYRYFAKILGQLPSSGDIVLSQTLVLSNHIQHSLKLDWHSRLQHLTVNDLKAEAKRAGLSIDTADFDDFAIDSDAWTYMARVDWDDVLEVAYNLYCTQQVTWLWGNKSSVNVSCALLIWAIQAVSGSIMPSITSWSRELTMPWGGNEHGSLQRRTEMKDMLVAWSTSFPEAGIPIPILPTPKRGTIGDGLTGYSSDKRRPIPEAVMAIAAARPIAENWRRIMIVRLRKRTKMIPLDVEFAIAARMFAKAYTDNLRVKKLTAKAAKMLLKRTSTPVSRHSTTSSRASSVLAGEPSPSHSSNSVNNLSPKPAAHFVRVKPFASEIQRVSQSRQSTSRDDMLRFLEVSATARILKPHYPSSPPVSHEKSPSIEALLAQRDDSSDEEPPGESDDEDPILRSTNKIDPAIVTKEKTGLGLLGLSQPPVAFGFSIGPSGFTVANDHSEAGDRLIVPVSSSLETNPRKRSNSTVASSDLASAKRPKELVPFNAARISRPTSKTSGVLRSRSLRSERLIPLDTNDSHLPRKDRSTSPALTMRTDTLSTKSGILTSISPSSSPSLRSVSMSPTLSSTSMSESSTNPSLLQIPVEENEWTRHIGLLLREREQYIRYRVSDERAQGRVVSEALERAMLQWVEDARMTGKIPSVITSEYLSNLGVSGDPRHVDLAPFISAHKHEWSPIECLLRLGLRPIEIPHHLVVHSHIGLAQLLGHYRLEDRLAPMGTVITETELDRELELLFECGDEHMSDILCTTEEADKREALYLDQNIWSHPRNTPEGRSQRLPQPPLSEHVRENQIEILSSHTPQLGSKRINYDALRRLGFTFEGDKNLTGNVHDEAHDEIEDAIYNALDDTLWGPGASDFGNGSFGDESDSGEVDDHDTHSGS